MVNGDAQNERHSEKCSYKREESNMSKWIGFQAGILSTGADL